MKLRNKKTGENYETTMPIVFNIKTSGGGEHTVSCESITELNEKWEDVPEGPKGIKDVYCAGDTVFVIMHNKKETMEAVEKLEAFKRLEEKGFEFTNFARIGADGWVRGMAKFIIPQDRLDDEAEKDLDLLFGGEE